MDVDMVQTLINSLGFPIVMVGACGLFIWKMHQSQLEDKKRLYEELSKSTAEKVEIKERSLGEIELKHIKEESQSNGISKIKRSVDGFNLTLDVKQHFKNIQLIGKGEYEIVLY